MRLTQQKIPSLLHDPKKKHSYISIGTKQVGGLLHLLYKYVIGKGYLCYFPIFVVAAFKIQFSLHGVNLAPHAKFTPKPGQIHPSKCWCL